MKEGDTIPDFEATDQHGNSVTLSGYLEKGPVVLFFYPKAMTMGCTQESCHFRDLAAEFEEAGAQRVGISADDVDRQKQFDDKHGLGYPLLSDPDRTVAKIFGVKRPGPLGNKRHTFVIAQDRSLMGAIRSETNMDKHADEALQVLSSSSG